MKKRITRPTKEPVERIKKPVVIKETIGLGDIVENITTATGIKTFVSLFLKGDDCGCEERKKTLNQVQFTNHKTKQVRCFTEDQYNDYTNYRKVRTLKYEQEHVALLIKLYAHVFAIQYNQRDLCSNCGGAYNIIKKIETNLDIVYDTYSTRQPSLQLNINGIL